MSYTFAMELNDVRRSLKQVVKAQARAKADRVRIIQVCRDLARRQHGQLMEQLVARRRELRLKVAQVAARMGMPRPSVARLEALGLRGNPTLDTLVRYAAAVGAVLRIDFVPGDWRHPAIRWGDDGPR
jgi:DNA-binding phage protein